MSGLVGSEYPGNLVMSVGACLMATVSIKSALSAYRRRREARRETTRLQNWEADLGVSIGTLLMFGFALYAIWVHR